MTPHSHSVEVLETRIAPATLTGQVLTYTDLDGDHVTLTISKGTLAGSMFTFNSGSVNGDNSTPQQLQLIDLSGAPNVDGADITMKVAKAGGDGFAAIGALDADTHNLGKIVLRGDLGRIEAGNTTPGTLAVKSLSVRSMGAFGLTTQGMGGDLTSNLHGGLGSLAVMGDVKDARINVFGALGKLTIGGSLIGGAANFSGAIGSTDDMGAVKIGGNLEGGAGGSSGLITTSGNLASIAIGGSLVGGANLGSGQIHIGGNIGPVTIAHDMLGGSSVNSGEIFGDAGTFTSITIGGSLVGGTGAGSGRITSPGDIGAVKIGQNLRGGAGDESGKLDVGGALTSLTIGGSVIGGSGDYNTITDVDTVLHSGEIFAVGKIGTVKIGRNQVAGIGAFSATIHSHDLLGGSVTIGGSILTDPLHTNVMLLGDAGIGAVKIVHDARGGITSLKSIASVTIGGTVIGDITSTENLGLVKVRGDVGDNAVDPTNISAGGTLAGLTVDGSTVTSVSIHSGGQMGLVKIGRDAGPGTVIDSSAGITGVTVGGSILSDFGSMATSSAITAAGPIGNVKVGRDATLLEVTTTAGGIGNVTVVGHFTTFQVKTPGTQGNVKAGSLSILGTFQLSATGGIGKITIAHDLSGKITTNGKVAGVSVGGDLNGSIVAAELPNAVVKGAVTGGFSVTKLGAVTVGGDLFGSIGGGDVASVAIGGSVFSVRIDSLASITASGRLGAVKIGGDLHGPSLEPGENNAGSSRGIIEGGQIGSVMVGGSLLAGIDDSNGATLKGIAMIFSDHEIESVVVKGDLRGTVGINGDVTPAIIVATNDLTGSTTDLAIGKVTIGGTVERGAILAGAAFSNLNGNGNASIGKVKVGGDWIASNLVAGVKDTNGNGFGNADDAVIDFPAGAAADAIVARIASITIGGFVRGTLVSGDHFGFIAQQIGSFKSLAFTAHLTSATDPATELSPTTADTTVREV